MDVALNRLMDKFEQLGPQLTEITFNAIWLGCITNLIFYCAIWLVTFFTFKWYINAIKKLDDYNEGAAIIIMVTGALALCFLSVASFAVFTSLPKTLLGIYNPAYYLVYKII